MENSLEVRNPNWLPLPVDIPESACPDLPDVSENDLFPKGEVASFYPKQGIGKVKNERGELIPFSISEIDLVGPKGFPKYLSDGARVGYDLSWTSHGMRISRMKVY